MSTNAPATPANRPAWHGQPFVIATLGSLLLLAAQPPLGWSYLAWLAPLPWLYLATRPELPGRRPYLQIWVAGFAYWVLAVHWIRLAHPATFLGLLLLAAYFGVYLPLFVKVVRLGVLRWSLPCWLVAPAAWVAIEWLQAHLLGGFLMGALGHTQIEQLRLVQVADLGGAYLVSALVMIVAACVWEVVMALPACTKSLPRWRTALAVAVAAASLGGSWWYGNQKLQQFATPADAPTKLLALVQGSERAVWTSDPGRDKRVMDVYVGLSQKAHDLARKQVQPLDLVVWPEGMFRTPMYSYAPDLAGTDWAKAAEVAPADLRALSQVTSTPLLVGIDRVHAGAADSPPDVYNSAVAVAGDGSIIDTYDKTHLVMFGEYVPGGTLWPGIYQFFPIGGVTPGDAPKAFGIDGVRYMPTICYETVIPHVVRRQVIELAATGERPDVLVNVTNDSWFYDSSELAMHLTCSRLRAIECRTPLVAAANGGLSASVDCLGRVLAVSQPMTEEVILVEVAPGGHDTLYLRYGDTFAIGCLVVTLVIIAASYFRRQQPASDH